MSQSLSIPEQPPSTGAQPIKALLLASEYPPEIKGGLGIYVYELATGLSRLGYEVIVLVYTSGEARVVRQPNLTVHFVPASPASLAQAGQVSFVQTILAFNDDLLAYARQLVDQERPDILHCHDWLLFPIARQLRQQFGLPIVGTFHIFHQGMWQYFGLEPDPEIGAQELALYHEADTLITVSESMRDLITMTYGGLPDRIQVVYNALDPAPFMKLAQQPSARQALRRTIAAPDEPLILYSGRLHPQKGIDALFAAAATVLDSHTSARYVVVGGTDSRESTQLIHDLQQRYAACAPRLKLLGKLPREQLALLYQIADLVVVPSLYEPFGYVAIEAMAAGRPVVASAVGGLAEIVVPEQTGLLVPVIAQADRPHTVVVEALAAAQLRLLDDPALGQRWGQAGQQRVLDLFNLPQLIRTNVGIYRQTLASSRRPVLYD